MDLQLNGSVCLVSGASAGIGIGIVRVLAREGARLAIMARRRDRLEAVADETGNRPLVVAIDLMREEAPRVIHDKVYAEFGRLDILVNNAGASSPIDPLSSDAEWDAGFDIKFTTTRRLTNAFLPGMREQKWGRIINVSGIVEPFGTSAAQAASAATHAWAKGLSRDLTHEGITVNCVPPGRINSEQILERLYPNEESRKAFIDAHIPIGRFGEPEELGYLVAFLASPLAGYITGTVIPVDGGMQRFAQ